MNPRLLTPLVLLAVAPAHALPFAVHSAPVDIDSSPRWNAYAAETNAATFFGAAPRWYLGGQKLSAYPASGTPQLPRISLPQWVNAVEYPLSHSIVDADNDGDMDIVRVIEWHHNGIITIQTYLNSGGTFTAGPRADWVTASYSEYVSEYETYWDDTFMEAEPGDYDRDGDVDLAILTTYEGRNMSVNPVRHEGQLRIRWNDGTGAFNSENVLQSTGFSRAANVEAADIDGDGDLDLLCSGQEIVNGNGSSTFSLRQFENDGDGIFTATTLSRRWDSLVMTDFNRDGFADCIFQDPATSKKAVALNDRSGGFPTTLSTNIPWGPYFVGDFDDDNIEDVATAAAGNLLQFVMHPGNGDGTFAAPLPIATFASGIAGAAASDADDDGDADLLVELSNGQIKFLENRAVHRKLNLAYGSVTSLAGVTQVLPGDFTKDGREDLLALTPSQNRIYSLAGNAGNTLDAPIFKGTASAAARAMAAGDFNRDGRPDIAYTLPGAGQVRQALNNGSTMTLWADSSIASLPGAALLRSGQFNLPNGYPALLVSSATTGAVRWLYGTGGLPWGQHTVLNSSSPSPGCLQAANVTSRPGDEPFLLSSDAASLRIHGYHQTPSWTLAGSLTQTTPVPSAQVLEYADVTNAGRKLMTFVQRDGSLAWWDAAQGGTSAYFAGRALGAVRDFKALDWNRDGRTDILCATSTGLELFEEQSGLFSRTQAFSRTGGYHTLAAMDMNRDGYPDVAAADTTGGQVHVLRNDAALVLSSTPFERRKVMFEEQTGIIFESTLTHPGLPGGGNRLGDAPVVFKAVALRFKNAAAVGSGFTPGGLMTKAQVDETVASVAIYSGSGVHLATGTTAALATGLEIPLRTGTEIAIPAGESRDYRIHLTLRPGAAFASYQRFYVELQPFAAKVEGGDGTEETALDAIAGTPRALITIVQQLSPLQQWRQTNFGSPDDYGSGANDADPDGDGTVNLMEYVMGRDPRARSLFDVPPLGLTSQGNHLPVSADLRLTNSYDPKVRLTIQRTSGAAPWTAVSTRTGTGAWTGVTPATTALSGGRTRFDFNTGIIPASSPRQLFRLRAEELP